MPLDRFPTAKPDMSASWMTASVLSRLILLTLIFFVFLAYVLDRSGSRMIYNSDLVMPFLLMDDVMKDPGALFTWYYSPALFVFPDWLLSALMVATPLSLPWLPLVYGAVMMALYCLAAAALLTTTGELRPGHAIWLAAAFLSVWGLLILSLDSPVLGIEIYLSLAAPFVHSGAVLSTLLAAALFLYLLQTQGAKMSIAIAGLCLLTFVAVFSDFLFAVWFVGPACITALFYAWALRQGRGVLLAILFAMTGLCGWAFGSLVNQHNVGSVGIGRGSLAQSAAVLGRWLSMSSDPIDVPMLLLALVTLALLARGVILTFRFLWRRTPSRGEVMELLLAGICAAAVLAPIAAHHIVDDGSKRYFLVLMLVPLLWVAYRLSRIAFSNPSYDLARFVPVCLVVLASAMALPAIGWAKRLGAAQPLQVCLEANRRTAGLGDYWTAKKLILESDRRIHIAQVNPDGAISRHNTNEWYFWSRSDTGKPPDPDFIVPKNLNVDALRRIFGPPDRVVDCAGQQLWLYDAPLSLGPPPKWLHKTNLKDALNAVKRYVAFQ